MRRLRLVIGKREGMGTAVLCATLVGACGGNGGEDGPGPATGGSGGAAGADGETGGGGTAGVPPGGGTGAGVPLGGSAGAGGAAPVCDSGEPFEYEVPLPEGDTRLDAAEECGLPAPPDPAAAAIRVRPLQSGALGTRLAAEIELAPELMRDGYIAISDVHAVGADVTISGPTSTDDPSRYRIELLWPDSTVFFEGYVFQLSVTVDYSCAPEMSSVRTITSATELAVCHSSEGLVWAGSGDPCAICAMAEVVARPIPAPPLPDGLPLPGELDLTIDAVARAGRSVVLLARTRPPSAEVSYRWRASGGELLLVAPDVAVWTPPAAGGPHQIQLAAETELQAAVATHLQQSGA